MTFHLRLPEAEAVLTFPGFVYDFTENTMARTIQFNIEGSGMAFRECVSRTGIDFDAYDRMFERAKLDDIPIITAILTGRLMYPCGLSMQAASRYEAYLRAHEERILSHLIEIKDRAAIRFLTGRRLLSREALAHTAPFAASSGDAQIAALLSSYAASLRTEQEDAKGGASKGSLTI